MNISVKVKPGAKQDKIEKIGQNSYAVWVKARAIEGRANQAAIKVLSDYFDVSRSKIMLIKGAKARDKIFEVNK